MFQFDNGKAQRVILHWTAGTNAVSALDREHYHFIVAGDGAIVPGKYGVAANDSTKDGDGYAAHTLGCNTGSIGVALAGMAGAVEQPFYAGKFPITALQWNAAAALVAALCIHYQIKVTPKTVLSHAEVEPTLGVKQRGKWDIARLPWNGLKGAVACGHAFRTLVAEKMLQQAVDTVQQSKPTSEDESPMVEPTAMEPVCAQPKEELSTMLPLVPTLAGIALSAAPEIARMLGGTNAAKVVETATDVVRMVTGTTDPEEAAKALASPETQALLRERLLLATRGYELEVDDRKDARKQTVELARVGSPIAYGPVLISGIVIAGFFTVLGIMLSGSVAESRILDTMLGLLGAAFMSVINYWVGSSSGSAAKSNTIDNMLKRVG